MQIRRAAELDVAAAQMWYETQHSGLGAEFQVEISNIVTRLIKNPFLYAAVYRDVRRAVVRRFPYLIWYRVLGDKVTVLACTHSRMNPATATDRFQE